ncbi:hypothetical protein GEMRC1_009102 [Eukaryota sp. GEM-RC1]
MGDGRFWEFPPPNGELPLPLPKIATEAPTPTPKGHERWELTFLMEKVSQNNFLEAYSTVISFLSSHGCTDTVKLAKRDFGVEIDLDEIEQCILSMDYFRALELISQSFKDTPSILQTKHDISLQALADAIVSGDNDLAEKYFSYNIGLLKKHPSKNEELLAQAHQVLDVFITEDLELVTGSQESNKEWLESWRPHLAASVKQSLQTEWISQGHPHPTSLPPPTASLEELISKSKVVVPAPVTAGLPRRSRALRRPLFTMSGIPPPVPKKAREVELPLTPPPTKPSKPTPSVPTQPTPTVPSTLSQSVPSAPPLPETPAKEVSAPEVEEPMEDDSEVIREKEEARSLEIRKDSLAPFTYRGYLDLNTAITKAHPLDSSCVLEGGFDGSVRLVKFEITNQNSIIVYQDDSRKSSVSCLCFSSDGGYFAAGSKSGRIAVYKMTEDGAVRNLSESRSSHNKPIVDVCFYTRETSNGSQFLVFSVSQDNDLKCFNAFTGELVHETTVTNVKPKGKPARLLVEFISNSLVLFMDNGTHFCFTSLDGDFGQAQPLPITMSKQCQVVDAIFGSESCYVLMIGVTSHVVRLDLSIPSPVPPRLVLPSSLPENTHLSLAIVNDLLFVPCTAGLGLHWTQNKDVLLEVYTMKDVNNVYYSLSVSNDGNTLFLADAHNKLSLYSNQNSFLPQVPITSFDVSLQQVPGLPLPPPS